jgi:hypothetical protein
MKINIRVACSSCTKENVCKHVDQIADTIIKVNEAVVSIPETPAAITVECTEREQIKAVER